MTDVTAESIAERWFRNYIKQFWEYLSDVEISGNEELRDEFFLSIRHGLQRPQAEMILRDMKHQIVHLNIVASPDAIRRETV